MKFDELEARLRVFETAHDQWVLPGIYMVARLDGRGFTWLTKEIHSFLSISRCCTLLLVYPLAVRPV